MMAAGTWHVKAVEQEICRMSLYQPVALESSLPLPTCLKPNQLNLQALSSHVRKVFVWSL